jgi:hypothetical protein
MKRGMGMGRYRRWVRVFPKRIFLSLGQDAVGEKNERRQRGVRMHK